jgi:hypothetical protein
MSYPRRLTCLFCNFCSDVLLIYLSVGYDDVRTAVRALLPAPAACDILVLGAGTSRMSEDMAADGYTKQVCWLFKAQGRKD